MEDIGNIIMVAVIVLFTALNAMKNKQRKAAGNTTPEAGESQPDTQWKPLSRQEPGPKPAAAKPSEPTSTARKIAAQRPVVPPQVISSQSAKCVDSVEVDSSKTLVAADEVQEPTMANFNLRDAVIYSEILNPKFKEPQ